MARAADGQLLAREDVLERARTTYAATPIEPFAAKGKAELIRASDVGTAVGEREQAAIGPFVGREAELDTLLAALRQAARGAGRARARDRVPPGLGKTRLLGELCAQAAGVPHAARAVRPDRRQPSLLGRRRDRPARAAARSPRAGARGRAAPARHGRRSAPRARAVAPAARPRRGARACRRRPRVEALEEEFVSERIATSVEALLDAPRARLGADRHRRRAVHGRGVGGADRPHRSQASATRRWLLVVAHRDGDGGLAAAARASSRWTCRWRRSSRRLRGCSS